MTGLMVSMLAFVSGVKDKLESEKGATATEYSLLVAFIAFVVIGGATIFGTALSHWFTDLGGTVCQAGPTQPAVSSQLPQSGLSNTKCAASVSRGRGTFLFHPQLHLSLGGSNEAQQVKGARRGR